MDPRLTQAKLLDPNHDALLINYFPSHLISIQRIIASKFEYVIKQPYLELWENRLKVEKGRKSDEDYTTELFHVALICG